MFYLKNLIFLIFIFYSSFKINAQQKITKKQFIADSLKIIKVRLFRPQIRLDNRLTFLNGQKLSISGIDAGVLLKEKLRATLGYYSVSDKSTSLKKNIEDIDYQGEYYLNYGAINLEFIYKNTRFFSLGMPLEFGFGNNTLNYTSNITNTQTDKQAGFIVMSYFGISGTFKPIRSIGLKAAFGYRKTLFNQIKNLAFDGIYTSAGLSIDFREIIKDYRMYKLKKTYRKNINSVETAIDLITD